MLVRLDDTTILDYLVQHGRCHGEDTLLSVKPLRGKNHNLLVKLATGKPTSNIPTSLLVKQQPPDRTGNSKSDFQQEWRIHTLLSNHEELRSLQSLVSAWVDFDPANRILITAFLEHYSDLGEFYRDTHQFSTTIAAVLGISLATLHQATFQRQEYRLELDPGKAGLTTDHYNVPDFHGELENLTPDLFKRISVDGLMFYKLYQRSDHLSQAIAQLEADYAPCCLIHNDLKFNNILLHRDWPRWPTSPLPASPASLHLPDGQGIIRVIDWEQWAWGDPAFDVGAVVAEYLRLWLQSLRLSRDIDIAVALRLATIPLVTLQPSLTEFLQAYLSQFPRIGVRFPDFVDRVLRFAGLGLIEAIQERLHYREPFGNLEIAMLQVAKSLLCQPESARITVFGCTTFSSWEFHPHTQITESIAPIPSTQGPNEQLAKASPPGWVEHYSRDSALADLVRNLLVEPPLIEHPSYLPLDLTQPLGATPSGKDEQRYRSLSEEHRQAYVLRQVRNYLYDIYFSGEQEKRTSPPPQDRGSRIDPEGTMHFFEQIQTANSGTGFLDSGWEVIRTEGDRAHVEKDGLRLWVNPCLDVAPVTPPTAQHFEGDRLPSLPVGTAVSLRLPNAYLLGEYYMAIGNGGQPAADQPCMDVYFNVSSKGVIVLMHLLTEALNRLGHPFTLKALHEPLSDRRFDATILHLESLHYPDLHSVLRDHAVELQPYLRDPIPLFTEPLAPGIGVAESPHDEISFGLDRCQILAQALLDSGPDPESRHRSIRQQFAQNKLNWERPHLNPGSTRRYPALGRTVLHPNG